MKRPGRLPGPVAPPTATAHSRTRRIHYVIAGRTGVPTGRVQQRSTIWPTTNVDGCVCLRPGQDLSACYMFAAATAAAAAAAANACTLLLLLLLLHGRQHQHAGAAMKHFAVNGIHALPWLDQRALLLPIPAVTAHNSANASCRWVGGSVVCLLHYIPAVR